MKSYAVIGLGRFGTKVATSLYELGEEVLAIDTNEELINSVADLVTKAVIADAKDKNVLKKLGISECDTAIVALGSDLASSVLITMNLKSLGVRNVICKAHDDTHREILEKIGADRVIIPEREEAEKLARSLVSPNVLELIELSKEHGIVEIATPKEWLGKSIREINIRDKYKVNVIAIKENDALRVNFPPDEKLTEEIKLVILGEYSFLDKLPE